MNKIELAFIAIIATAIYHLFDGDINAVIDGFKTGFHMHPFVVVFDSFDTVARVLDDATWAMRHHR